MRLLYFLLISPFILISQTQIGNDIDGVRPGDRFGTSVSISSDGSIVAIGAPYNENAGTYTGHVRVFENISGVWIQIGDDINGAAAGDGFGTSVSIASDGTKVAIGGPGNDTGGNVAGQVRVFENISGVWTQIGGAINGSTGNLFGHNVSLSNNSLKIAIGAPGGDYVSVYENISGNWIQLGSDFYGYFFAFSGDGLTISVTYGYWDNFVLQWVNVMVVYRFVEGIWNQDINTIYSYGSIFSNISYDGTIIAITSGNVTEIYDITTLSWSQIDNTIMSYGTNIEISSNGSIVAIGGSDTPEDQVQIFYNIDNSWTQIGSDIDGENIYNSLSLSGDGSTIAIGAPLNDDNGTDAGQVRVYDLSALLSVDKSSMLSVKLYPNPTTNQFTIDLPLRHTLEKVNIYNNIGQFIQTSQKNIINTSKLASGHYYVEVVTARGKATKKLVIK